MVMKILLHVQNSPSKQSVGKQVWFVLNLFGGISVGDTPERFGYFYSYLSLETVFPARKLTQNFCINISISFY